ncbi:MAG: PKD domain-containing protein [Thermoplasmatota archaeon]
MTRNAYVQICALLVVVALAFPGLSLADGGDGGTGAASMLQDRTMSINGVAVDGDDNVIVTGEVYDEGAGKWIIRTEKYDGSDGHLLWQKEFKQYDQNIGKDVAVDGSGNVIVAGAIGSAGDLLPNMDYFLIKYSKNGDQMWKETYNNGLSDVPWRLTVDRQTGNIFVTGVTIKLVGSDSATSNFWTIKCSGSNGGQMEQHVLDINENADMGVGIGLTSDREVVVTGSTQFDAPDYDAYCTQRYSTSLEPIGTPFFYRGENTNESASGLAIDSSDNLFVTGHSSSRSGQDFLTVKYDKNGAQTGKDLRDVDEAKNSGLDVAVDHADNVIITGSTVSDGNHFCTIKYSNNLEKQWIQQEDFVGEAKAVTVDSQNNVIVAGYNTGQDDQYYTIKYDPNGNILWQGGGGAAPSEPPAASFTGPSSAYAGQPVQFTDTSSGAVTSRSWDFGDGGTGSGATVTHTYSSPDTYTVTLTVSGAGETDTATRQVTITNAPPNPSFTYTPLTPTVDESVSFDASDSYDPYGGSIASYSWDFGDDSSGSGETTSHTYTENGTYTVTLTVTDGDGKSASTSKMVTVNQPGSHAPTARFDYEPSHPAPGDEVTFDASASTDDSTILLYRWDWDDDGIYDAERAAPTATHTWEEAGAYTVTLEVEDNNGTVNTYTDSITVSEGQPSLLLSAPSSVDVSGGSATAIVTVSCFNQTVEGVSIEVEDDAGANVNVTPATATIQAGAQRHFEMAIEMPGNATSGVIRLRAVGGDTESQSVDIQLESNGDDTPGFAAVLAIAAIFLVLLVMRRFKESKR